MLDHISLGVGDIAASRRFYDAVLQPLGYHRVSDYDSSSGYGDSEAQLWLLATDRPVPADTRSGLHICFAASSRTDVDAFHAAALRSGGRDNGAPGLRADYGDSYYAAFAIDPDGYRIEAHCAKKESR